MPNEKELEIINQKLLAKRKKETIAPVSVIIDSMKTQLGLDVDFFVLAKLWEKEFGADVEICGYKKGTLLVETQSFTAMSEINLRKKEILNRLNQYIGGGVKIKNIKLRIKD
ncbi:MAG: DUF721 domain-containing protein [Elusimicrobiota bacterium]|jgi:hypothetical protein|nr:DUF721 domain-containing protein [Elusimicrobiota bacterium]